MRLVVAIILLTLSTFAKAAVELVPLTKGYTGAVRVGIETGVMNQPDADQPEKIRNLKYGGTLLAASWILKMASDLEYGAGFSGVIAKTSADRSDTVRKSLDAELNYYFCFIHSKGLSGARSGINQGIVRSRRVLC